MEMRGVRIASGALLALAIATTTAQAAVVPRWYSNHVEIKPGVAIPIVTWGGSANLSQTSEVGEVNCRTVGAGTIVNPVGGGAGEGKTDESTFFECKCAGCEAAGKEMGIPLDIYVYATTNGGTGPQEEKPLAWKNLLTGGPGDTEIGETIGEPFSGTFGAPTAGEIVVRESCETPPGFSPHIVGLAVTFEGELKPKIVNGAAAGSKPSQVAFSGAATGALHAELGGGEQTQQRGEGTNSGKVKFQGYNGQELITAEG
jgi:hypothetical protein